MTQSINNNPSSGYRSFADIGEENQLLIHVLPAEREDHPPWKQYMHDLDDFFIRLYKYHQKSGFFCLVFSQLLELGQMLYAVFLPIFFINYIDYGILFRNKPLPDPTAKVHIYDVIKPYKDVSIPSTHIVAIILVLIFSVWKFVKTIHLTVVNIAIKKFYRDILHIKDCSSMTWQDVQARLISSKSNFLAQDSHLTELDVHNRILRHSNYMIALINRGVLPIYYKVPFIGETVFFTQSFLYNCQLLFFRGPFKCIFDENWSINEDVKNSSHRQLVAKQLQRKITILAIINLFLSPVLMVWRLLYFFYSNTALVKRDPEVLGLRNWSLYARWFCRHFNELDHQLNDRLNRAYKPAKHYMDAFTSPLLEIVARHIRFVTGSTFAILLLLTIYDEDVIQVTHLLTIITALWLLWSSAGGFIPPEIPLRFTKTELYEQILRNIHYLPHNYPPFTPQAKSSMGDLFQYKLQRLIEDLLSTLATPYVMIRHLRPRALEIVDFFRTYTVEIVGTGDVCIFAMMNIKDNGNPNWQPVATTMNKSQDRSSETGDGRTRTAQDSPAIQKSRLHSSSISESTPRHQKPCPIGSNGGERQEDAERLLPSISVPQFERESLHNHAMPLQTEHGKLELSLINFKLQNPSWNPSNETQREYIHQVTSQALEQASSRQLSNLSQDGRFEVQGSVGSGTFARPKSPLNINDIDSSTAVSLSTLFLHEHARMPLSSNFPSASGSGLQQKPKSETDPLL